MVYLRLQKDWKNYKKNNPFTLKSDQQVISPHLISKHCQVQIWWEETEIEILTLYSFIPSRMSNNTLPFIKVCNDSIDIW